MALYVCVYKMFVIIGRMEKLRAEIQNYLLLYALFLFYLAFYSYSVNVREQSIKQRTFDCLQSTPLPSGIPPVLFSFLFVFGFYFDR